MSRSMSCTVKLKVRCSPHRALAACFGAAAGNERCYCFHLLRLFECRLLASSKMILIRAALTCLVSFLNS